MKKILSNVKLINLVDGSNQLSNIYIDQNGKIEKIQAGQLSAIGDYQVFDGGGNYLIPGLINLHAHLFSTGKPVNFNVSPRILNFVYSLAKSTLGKKILRSTMTKHAQTELMTGVTTIRLVGEFFYQDVKLRDEILTGKVAGPTLLVSGFFLSVTDGHGAPYLALTSDSPWEGRKNVRKNIKQGVDWIKICVTGGVTDARRIGEAGALQLTLPEIEAICDETHKNGMMVAAHVESTEGLRIALQGGVDTIEHGAHMDEEIIELFKHNPRALRGYSTLTPTFQAAVAGLMDPQKTKIDPITYANSRAVYESMLAGCRQALIGGIKLGMGNDASMAYVTHYDFWRELHHLVKLTEASPLQALNIVTKNNAEILGIDEHYGTVEVGKMADLLLLKEDPTKDVRSVKEVAMVFKHGQQVNLKPINRYPGLDHLLDQL
jgi:imidazolonepropionase-like amidohydrolase